VFTCYIQFAVSNDLDQTLRRPTQSYDTIQHRHCRRLYLDSSWNVMAHGGEWRGNWRIEWVASTLHTTPEHGVSSITTAVAHTSAASNPLNWFPADLNGLVRFAERRYMVSARVPSHFNWPLLLLIPRSEMWTLRWKERKQMTSIETKRFSRTAGHNLCDYKMY